MIQADSNKVSKKLSKAGQLILIAAALFGSQLALAQDVEQVRWKSESHVKGLYGEPNSVRGPIGTHATYKLWQYDNFTVAFANNRAFHLFTKDSLQRLDLEEDRSGSDG